MLDLALLLGGGALLYFGAEWLVGGAAGLAARLGVRPLVIGLTVVAYGTSAPELVVAVGASLDARPGIAFGNAIGSNIANVGLILGLTALISPPTADASLRQRELPVLGVSAILVPLLLIDGRLGRLDGAALLLGAVAYTLWMVRGSKVSAQSLVAEAEEVADEARAAAGTTRPTTSPRLAALALGGLVTLVVGGRLFVEAASRLAAALGVSERMVGLTIVAIGTSLPELATSLIAARRGHSDIAVGNVVGSNIFNVLLVLGGSALAAPLFVSLREARTELAGLLAMTLAAIVLLRTQRTLTRPEGALLVVSYVVVLVVTAW